MRQQPPASTEPSVRFIRRTEVIRRTGISDSERQVLARRGEFPKQVQISPRCVAWVENEIDAWCRERIAARDAALAVIGPPVPRHQAAAHARAEPFEASNQMEMTPNQ